MAGSPAYLELLEHAQTLIKATPPIPGGEWFVLEQAWKEFEASQHRGNLMFIATQAYRIYAQERGLAIEDVILTARDLHIAKNAGYAGAENPDPWANFRLAAAFGVSPVQGVFVRMSDKWSRILALRRDPNNERVGESLLDTIADLAAYALIAICMLDEYDRTISSRDGMPIQ